MYAVDLQLKSGKKLEGLIWTMDPPNDSITLMSERDGERYEFAISEIAGGVFYSDRIRELSSRQSFLDKMREMDWPG